MTALIRQGRRAVVEVTDDSLRALLAWVTDATTPVEEIAWSASEFQSIRDWLKAHKAAQDLRMRAVRAELIALRRVGLAGLSHKLSGGNVIKPVATWLAERTDDEFSTLLDELTSEQTPVSLWRKAKREAENLDTWLTREQTLSGARLNGLDQHYQLQGFRGVADAARRLLDDIQIEGTSFTVQEAADRLAVGLEEDGIQVHQAMRGTPLTQLIRNAIHRAADGYETYATYDGRTVRVPAFVTYEDNEGITRVPFHSASLKQVEAFVELHESKAAALTARAEEYRALLETLQKVTGDEELPASRLLSKALGTKRLRSARSALAEGDAS